MSIIRTTDPSATLAEIARIADCDTIILITDKNVEEIVLPRISDFVEKHVSQIMNLEPGEETKNLDTLESVWSFMSEMMLTRRSMIINFGGGVITDLGGFAAATFKRGIRYVNVPTTLLAAADAAIGGKTGINFAGLKNEIGCFAMPLHTVICGEFFSTLPQQELLSGYGEIVKSAMISSRSFYNRLLVADDPFSPISLRMNAAETAEVKQRIVEEDPYDKGKRKILNFGHTAGHAFEGYFLNQGVSIPHGEAVAHGIAVALILSRLKCGARPDELQIYLSGILKRYYRPLPLKCGECGELVRQMECDKKNSGSGDINFVLLPEIGKPIVDVAVTPDEAYEALEIYMELL